MGRNQTAKRTRKTRLRADELSVFLASCPPGAVRIVQTLRSNVRRCAPGASEAIKFHSICFYEPGARFGSIGGNICMIEDRPNGIRLSFIQGAGLPDPSRLLRGTGKAKRFIDMKTAADARSTPIAQLLRSAARRARAAAHEE